jgi:hypothetical protein
MMTFSKGLAEYKHLILVSSLTFLLIYLSSFAKGYGYFIDEFYYIACAAHPALGYVDHPPLAPLVLTVFQFLFGTSLYAVRVLPALVQSVTVFFTGVVTGEIGGGKFAQLLASCSMAAAPMFIAFGGFYSMNAFEPLLAVALLHFVVRMIKDSDVKQWISIGLITGMGVMNKHTFALFVAALLFSLVLSGKWKLLFNRWLLIGGVIGFVLVLPNVIWQAANDFPSIEFYRNISSRKNVFTPPLPFIMGQISGMSPCTVPVWCVGTWFLLFSGRMKDFRFLAILFLTLFAFMMYSGTSRSDRMIFAYPGVFAGGAIWIDDFLAKYTARWLKGAVVVLLFGGLVIALPIILPYFDYETVRTHVARLGLNTEIEKGKKPPLPQLLADRIGWEEKYALVLKAYRSLSPEERKESIIAAGNYGDAGAIELFGKQDSIPPVVCGHNTYYLWSKGRLHGTIVLLLTQKDNVDRLKESFESVHPAEGEYSSPYVSYHENNLRVFICRGPKIPLPALLERERNFS